MPYGILPTSDWLYKSRILKQRNNIELRVGYFNQYFNTGPKSGLIVVINAEFVSRGSNPESTNPHYKLNGSVSAAISAETTSGQSVPISTIINNLRD